MIIDTKYNIGDKVWGVTCDWHKKDVACEACKGKGGANIPGTGVWVECRQCAGDGLIEGIAHRYKAAEETIASISIEVESRNNPKCRYGFRRYRHSHVPTRERVGLPVVSPGFRGPGSSTPTVGRMTSAQ